MEGIILLDMQTVVNYCGWIILWVLLIVVPAAAEVIITLREHYNHKGYWLNGVDLERYIDNVPIEVPKEDR